VHRRGLLALWLAASGCPAPAPPPSKPVPAAQPSASATVTGRGQDIGRECREQIAGLKDWLGAIERAGLPLAVSLLDEGAHLVEHQGAPVTEPAPLVHVTTSKVYLDGLATTELTQSLAELIELRRTMSPESPFIKSPLCYVAVDGDVTWARVVATMAEVEAAGMARATFVFSDAERPVPLPPPSPIDRELERWRQGTEPRRGQIIAELVALVYQDCRDALRVIASMGSNPVADFKQVLLDELPDAIGDCGCAADLSAVKALHWALFGNPRPMAGYTLALHAESGPEPSLVQRAGEVTWTEAHAAVAAAASDDDTHPQRLAVLPAEPAPKPKPRR
jgi:hypothetical protein